jgi:hypothetical protein
LISNESKLPSNRVGIYLWNIIWYSKIREYLNGNCSWLFCIGNYISWLFLETVFINMRLPR